jgi:hypothetical protein
MPVRQLRRLEVPTGSSLHARLSREALSYAWAARDVDALPAQHPELIVERDENILVALRGDPSRLAYAFESDAAFVDLFPPMLEQLLPRIRKSLRADTVRFRLALGSSRSAVEPVLKNWFAPRSWLTFSLSAPPQAGDCAKSRLPRRHLDDLAAIAHIDRESFPTIDA